MDIVNRHGGIVGQSSAYGSGVGKPVIEIIALGISTYAQMVVKELGIEVEAECETIHLGCLKNTITIGIGD